jgi:hypothetical protein
VTHRWAAAFFAAATLSVLLVYFAFAMPTGDDFCKATYGRDRGFETLTNAGSR